MMARVSECLDEGPSDLCAALRAVSSGAESWAAFEWSLPLDLVEEATAVGGHGRIRRIRSNGDLVERLEPVTASEARPSTLSGIFGLSEFPAHVDGAHLQMPPRMVIIWCERNEQRRSTLLLRWDDIAKSIDRPTRIEREVFRFRSGKSSLIDSIESASRSFVRYDPGCMIPGTRGSERLLLDVRTAIERAPVVEVDWHPGQGVVFDNWRLLHSRSAAKEEGDRLLWRAWLDLDE